MFLSWRTPFSETQQFRRDSTDCPEYMGFNYRTRIQRRHLRAMGFDALLVVFVYYAVINYRYDGTFLDGTGLDLSFGIYAAVAVAAHLTANWFAGVYTILNRYVGLAQAVRLCQATAVAIAALFILDNVWLVASPANIYLVPRSVVLAGGVVLMAGMVGARFIRRAMYEAPSKTTAVGGDRVLLVGAGQAADMLIREVQRTPALNVHIVGLLDDNPKLHGMSVHGYPVVGRIADAPRIAKALDVNQVIVAIPSASAEQVAHIYRLCKPAEVPIKILPSLADLVSGSVSLRDARDLEVKDLLGRPKVATDLGAISDYLEGHVVLVTGAGGSIGSELCRQIARFQPERLVLVDHDESALYDLHESLQTQGFRRYSLYPTTILHRRKMEKIFDRHRPGLVFHAAAYKHVPLMELNPDEAVLNNILGALIVGETAAKYGAERFVNISTDKAVEPVNVMGATKRAGELIMHSLAQRLPQTTFASVRFGNVLGSQGSVIPIFQNQIESGGPVVITHPEMTRFFMLIEEAVQLVLQTAIMMNDVEGGDSYMTNTFVLEMGEPVSIVKLAQQLIEFYWKEDGKSIGVEFSGLRPGEKLDESLVWPEEMLAPTTHELVKRVCLRPGASNTNGASKYFEQSLRQLVDLAERHASRDEILRGLMRLVPGYIPLVPLHAPVSRQKTLV